MFDAANLPIIYAGPAEFAQMLTNVTAFNRAELVRMGLITDYGGTLTPPCVAGSAPILPRCRTRATLRRMAMSIGLGGFPSALAAVMIGMAQSVRCTA